MRFIAVLILEYAEGANPDELDIEFTARYHCIPKSLRKLFPIDTFKPALLRFSSRFQWLPPDYRATCQADGKKSLH